MTEQPTQRRLVELGAALGVTLALVYVGLAVAQQADATRRATLQSIADAHREMTIWFATDQQFRSAVTAATEAGDVNTLDPADQRVIRIGWRAVFGHWATLHDHYVAGDLPEHVWQGIALEIEEVQTQPTMRWAWATEGDKYSEAFQDLMQVHINRFTPDDD